MSSTTSLGPSRVLVIGDTHSFFNAFQQKILPEAFDRGIFKILSVGDWENTDGGDPDYSLKVQKLIEPYGISVDYVDGNHDPHFALQQKTGGVYSKPVRIQPNISYFPRGYRWVWQGVRFLAAGGAYSIDREAQEKHGVYEPGEILTAEDVKRCLRGGYTDIVIAHDCPTEIDLAAEHANRRPWTRGNSPETDLNRSNVSTIVNETRASTVIHGHYHLDYEASYGGETRVIGLGANGETGSCRVLTLHQGQYSIERIDSQKPRH